jgi:hypothetical protein
MPNRWAGGAGGGGGGGGGGAGAVTTAVAAAVVEAEPFLFVAVTIVRNVKPTSSAVGEYVEPVWPERFAQLVEQRTHWYR